MDDTLVQQLMADHSRNPRNYGDLTDPDIEWQTDNPQCVGPTHPAGDHVTLAATLSDETPPVVDTVRFIGQGCTLSQATASLLTEEMLDTPVHDILEWDHETLEELVGMELTPSRLKCAELALVAFRQAIDEHDITDGTTSDDYK